MHFAAAKVVGSPRAATDVKVSCIQRAYVLHTCYTGCIPTPATCLVGDLVMASKRLSIVDLVERVRACLELF